MLHKTCLTLAAALLGTTALLTITMGAQAAQIATDPGDYAAAPAGTDLALAYFQYADRNDYYAKGDKLPGAFSLETEIALARWVHFMDIGGFTVDPQVILPMGRVDLNTAFGPLQPTSATGVGDPMVGGTVWLYNQPQDRQWFGLSAFASVPVGQYKGERGPVNVGENRWKGIFQAGYVRPLYGDWMIDLIGEAAIYGDNDDYLGLQREQDPTWGLQAHLSYPLSPSTKVALSYFHDFGGESTLGGVAQDDAMNTNRWMATVASFVTPTVQVQVQGGTDIAVENGARENARINLRLLKVF